jgi:hypothetical protein
MRTWTSFVSNALVPDSDKEKTISNKFLAKNLLGITEFSYGFLFFTVKASSDVL